MRTTGGILDRIGFLLPSLAAFLVMAALGLVGEAAALDGLAGNIFFGIWLVGAATAYWVTLIWWKRKQLDASDSSMFRFFKQKPTMPYAGDLKQLTASACEDVKEKWIHFHQTVHLKADVPLSEKIDFFIQPVQQFFHSKYPVLLEGPSEIFWLTVFTAIIESGTHPKEAVNAAIVELKKKYGRS